MRPSRLTPCGHWNAPFLLENCNYSSGLFRPRRALWGPRGCPERLRGAFPPDLTLLKALKRGTGHGNYLRQEVIWA